MEQPIRVMHVVGRMMGGGVEATVMNHYRHIDRSRVQFDFVMQSDSTVVPKEEIETLEGRIFIVPPYSNPIAYMQACHHIFVEERPQIVHSHMNALSVFPLCAAKRAGVPVRIAHSHSASNPGEGAKTTIKNILRPFSTVYPTDLAACSDYAARWLFKDALVDEGRVHLIRNAIELSAFVLDYDARRLLRAEIGAADSTLVLGQVGRLCFQKNQEFTLDVFSRVLAEHPDAILVIIGVGDNLKKLIDKAHDLHIDQNVRFLGARLDVSRWYSAFDALLFPSTYEGLGMVAIEAQVSGLPVIASDEVPQEVDIVNNLVHHVSLAAGSGEWSKLVLNLICSQSFESRTVHVTELEKAGYDIDSSARELADWYEKILLTNTRSL